MSKASRDTEAGHGPEESVKSTWLLREKIPSRVMSCSSLWYLAVRAWLYRMDKIRKSDSILNEEHWDVVSNNVLILLVSFMPK